MSSAGRDGSSPSIRATTLVRLGCGLEHGRLEPDLGEQLGDVLGRRALPRALVVPGVGGVDPDQVAGQAGDLVLRGGACGRVLVVIRTSSHAAPHAVPLVARLQRVGVTA